MANSLEAERKRPDSSFLASPPASWMDDFLQWTNPTFESCCRVRRRDPSVFCSPRDSDRLCRPCFEGSDWDITMKGLPENDDFMKYLQQWLVSPTDESCPLGGQAAYSSAVTLNEANTTVVASHFRTYHTPLKTQDDFINALSAARRVSADITKRTGVKVFPYSLFYVFFDQYEHVESIAVQLISLGILAVLVITSVLLGSWRTGATVTFTCLLAVLNVMGVMGYWGVSLNAISLVNLVISLGIAVEFCSHIARAFMGAGSGLPYDKDPAKERNDRAFTALVDVGPSVSITHSPFLLPMSLWLITVTPGLFWHHNDQTDWYLGPRAHSFEAARNLLFPHVAHPHPLGRAARPRPLARLAHVYGRSRICAGGYRRGLGDEPNEAAVSHLFKPAVPFSRLLIPRFRMDYEYAPFADTDSIVSDD